MDDTTTPHTYTDPLLAGQTASRLLLRRTLVLDRELTEENGSTLSSQLLLLAADDPRRDVTVLINSPGGLVHEMLAIADLMRLVPCDVRTVALGVAASAGQFILSAGTPGKRFALPHARVLMHQGSAGFGGSAADVEIQADDLRRSRDLVIELTARATGQSAETIRRDSDRDRWWDAEAARDYGFVDHIVAGLADVLPETAPRRSGVGADQGAHA